MNTQHLVDLDKMPPDERPFVREIAFKYNAFVVDTKTDFAKIAGDTPEEVETTGKVLATLRYMGNSVVEAFGRSTKILLPVALIAITMKCFNLSLDQLKELLSFSLSVFGG